MSNPAEEIVPTEQIAAAKFRRTRLREGYDRDEVESFHQKATTALYQRDQRILNLEQELSSRAPIEEVEDLNEGNNKNLLSVARRLYEQHVAEGVQQRDIIISEGRVVAARLISESESALRARLSDLNTQREEIELAIQQKIEFEKNYSAGLKAFIKDQAEKLDATDSITLSPRAEVAADKSEDAVPVMQNPGATSIADINAMSVEEDDEEPVVHRGTFLPPVDSPVAP